MRRRIMLKIGNGNAIQKQKGQRGFFRAGFCNWLIRGSPAFQGKAAGLCLAYGETIARYNPYNTTPSTAKKRPKETGGIT
jgi:hypothetical protein